MLSHVQLFVTPWTVALQPSLSMEFAGQEYWSGSPFPSPRDLPNTGIEPTSPALAGGSLPLSHQGSPAFASTLDQSVEYEYIAVIHTDGFDYIKYALQNASCLLS